MIKNNEKQKTRPAKGLQLKGGNYKLKTEKNLITNKKDEFWGLC